MSSLFTLMASNYHQIHQLGSRSHSHNQGHRHSSCRSLRAPWMHFSTIILKNAKVLNSSITYKNSRKPVKNIEYKNVIKLLKNVKKGRSSSEWNEYLKSKSSNRVTSLASPPTTVGRKLKVIWICLLICNLDQACQLNYKTRNNNVVKFSFSKREAQI